MKIAIVGGKNKADFLIESLLDKEHSLMVINDDINFCNYLAKTYKIPVFNGEYTKIYTLRDAGIENYDIVIALAVFDSDNLAICQAAKRLFNVRKTVAVVSNPKYVDIFNKLGVDNAISATYLLANIIEQVSVADSCLLSLSVEHNKLMLTEILLENASPWAYRCIGTLELPENTVIGCVLRGNDMLAGDLNLKLMPNDKLVILSPPEIQNRIIATVSGKLH